MCLTWLSQVMVHHSTPKYLDLVRSTPMALSTMALSLTLKYNTTLTRLRFLLTLMALAFHRTRMPPSWTTCQLQLMALWAALEIPAVQVATSRFRARMSTRLCGTTVSRSSSLMRTTVTTWRCLWPPSLPTNWSRTSLFARSSSKSLTQLRVNTTTICPSSWALCSSSN